MRTFVLIVLAFLASTAFAINPPNLDLRPVKNDGPPEHSTLAEYYIVKTGAKTEKSFTDSLIKGHLLISGHYSQRIDTVVDKIWTVGPVDDYSKIIECYLNPKKITRQLLYYRGQDEVTGATAWGFRDIHKLSIPYSAYSLFRPHVITVVKGEIFGRFTKFSFVAPFMLIMVFLLGVVIRALIAKKRNLRPGYVSCLLDSSPGLFVFIAIIAMICINYTYSRGLIFIGLSALCLSLPSVFLLTQKTKS